MAKRATKTRRDFGSKAEYHAWLKRSKAAKKGARTKKKKELEKQIKNSKKKLSHLKKPKRSKKKTSKKKAVKKSSKPKIRKTIKQLKEEIRELKEEIEISKWPRDFMPGFLHIDGTLAIEKCDLRQHKDAVEIFYTLRDGYRAGHIYKTALEISLKYDAPIREVFTLLYSP